MAHSNANSINSNYTKAAEKKLIKYLLIPFYLFFIQPIGEGLDWSLVKQDKHIKVYTASIKGNNFKMIKASVEIDAPIERVAAVIFDIDNYEEWGYQCKESRLIKRPQKNEIIFYYISSIPWPMANRDLVSHLVVKKISDKEVLFESSNIHQYVDPKPDIVRVPKSHARWHLVELGENKTRAEYRVELDPGGYVPSWLVNLFITDGPYKTLSAMRSQVNNSRYKSFSLDQIFD
jgi:hypothetical protein